MTSNRRRRAELLRKSTSGQPLSYGDRVWLRWTMTDPRRMRIGGAWVWAVRAVIAAAVWGMVYFGLRPLIGGWALLAAAMAMVALGARWIK